MHSIPFSLVYCILQVTSSNHVDFSTPKSTIHCQSYVESSLQDGVKHGLHLRRLISLALCPTRRAHLFLLAFVQTRPSQGIPYH